MTSKRRALIDAAKSLLHQRGYAAMSPATVLEASGAGQGSLYHHFAGKRELAAAALDEVSEELRLATLDILSADFAPIERIRRYLAVPRDGLAGCRLGRFAFETSIFDEKLRDPILKYFEDLHEKLTQSLIEAVQAGELPGTTNPADLALTLISIVQGGYVISRIYQDSTLVARSTGAAIAMLDAIAPAR